MPFFIKLLYFQERGERLLQKRRIFCDENVKFITNFVLFTKYTLVRILRLVFRCILVARKDNLTVLLTGLTGRSKNLNLSGNPTGFHLRPGPPLESFLVLTLLKINSAEKTTLEKLTKIGAPSLKKILNTPLT